MSDDSLSSQNLSLDNEDDHHIPCFGTIDGKSDIFSHVEPQWDEDIDEPSSEEDEENLLTELRQLSKNLTNGHDRKKYQAFATEESPPRKVSQKEFVAYYKKSVSKFLMKKENDLAKKRKEKEAIETSELKAKPSLISKHADPNRIPLLNRMGIIKEKKEKELARLKKEKEEKLERELSELTFKPKINRAPSQAGVVIQKRAQSPPLNSASNSGQLSSRMNTQQSTQRDRSDVEDGFRPKINKNSRNIAQGIIEDSSRDVVERLYSQVPAGAGNNISRDGLRRTEKKSQSQAQPMIQKSGSLKENKNNITGNQSGNKSPKSPKKVSEREIEEEASINQDLENNSQGSNEGVNKFGVQQLKVPTVDLERYEEEKNRRGKMKVDDNILSKIAAEISGVKNSSMGNQAVMDQLRQLLSMYSHQELIDPQGNILTESLMTGESDNKESARVPEERKKESLIKPVPVPVKKEGKKVNKENMRSKPKQPEETSPINDSNLNDELEIASIKQNLLDIQGNLQTLKESFQHFQTNQTIPEIKLKFLQSPRQDPQPIGRSTKSPRETSKGPLTTIQPSNTAASRSRKSVSKEKSPVAEKAPSLVLQSSSQTPRSVHNEVRSRSSIGTSPISPHQNRGNMIVMLPSTEGYSRRSLNRNPSTATVTSTTNRDRSEKRMDSIGFLVEKECQTDSLQEIPVIKPERIERIQQPAQNEMSFAVRENPRKSQVSKVEMERIDEKMEIDQQIEMIEKELNIERFSEEKKEAVVIRIKDKEDVGTSSLRKFKDHEIFRLKELDVEKPNKKRETSKGSRSRSRNKGNNEFGYQNSINMLSSQNKGNDGKGSSKSLKEIAQLTLMRFKGDGRTSIQGSMNDFQRILPAFE